ncbi:hypothetical protein [Undibacterium umbellatum]|uniref:Uncharacterized protein n=1 Tax=Undibacterium umbellatum TaxID=2762300 RepID=A0ABR6Z9M2_9BURK|nr:hypothetical protein [Undibacterium umbellatum]MBC3907877.1 hypothetical protein [Undibacterium umbellatum]
MSHSRNPPTVVLRMSGMPNLDKLNEIYIHAKVSNDGGLNIPDWSYVRNGMCFEHADKTRLKMRLV